MAPDATGGQLPADARSGLPVLVTVRLRLRPLREGDADFLCSLDTDPIVMKHVHQGALRPEEARGFAGSRIALARSRRRFGRWIAEDRETGEPLGWVELHPLYGRDRQDLQAGYQFAPRIWSRGYATEALRVVLDYALGPGGLDRVAAIVRPENAASIRVLERCGFTRTAETVTDGAGKSCQLWFRRREPR